MGYLVIPELQDSQLCSDSLEYLGLAGADVGVLEVGLEAGKPSDLDSAVSVVSQGLDINEVNVRICEVGGPHHGVQEVLRYFQRQEVEVRAEASHQSSRPQVPHLDSLSIFPSRDDSEGMEKFTFQDVTSLDQLQ